MLYDVNDLDYLEVYLISAIFAFMGTYGTFFVLLNRIRAPPLINSKNGLIGGNKMESNNPKRRKSKDNPYIINYNEINNTYFVNFNFNRKEEKIKISKEIYDEFNKFELNDLKQINEKDRHIDMHEATDDYIFNKTSIKNNTVEDFVENKIINEELQKAISSLSEIQKRRIIKYYFDGKNENEIAKEENTTHQSVHISLERAKQNLYEILKNFKF